MNIFCIFRILIGGLFVFSGLEKLLGPYQNFLYVIQGYEVFPTLVEIGIARAFPWLEVLLGIFALLGLWTLWTLRGLLIFIAGFITIVGQAIIRKLPIEECGCFGTGLSLPLEGVIIFDSFLFMMILWLLRNAGRTIKLSVDDYFSQQ